VKYVADPIRTFEIEGTDIKGVELSNLRHVLSAHQSNHPGSHYELVADVKCQMETIGKIKAAFKDAGAKLEHYWVPVSDIHFEEQRDAELSPKYDGKVDLLRDQK
jgi:hypothetical protein